MPVFFPRSIGPVFIDVVLSERFAAGMEIPEHPVERGAKISDHAWRKPDTLKIEFIHGDVTDTLRALRDLMETAEPFDILSGFDLHQNMMIEGIEPTRDVIYAQTLFSEITFKEVIIVGSASTPGNAGTGGDERAQGKTARGQVQARQIDTSSGRGAQIGSLLAGSRSPLQ